MEVFETAGHSGGIEPSLVSCEGFHISEVCEQLSAVDEFQHQIEVPGILGESLKGDDERMADLRMDEVLVVDMVDLLRLHDFMLVQQLQSHILARFLILSHLDLAKATYFKPTLTLAQDPPHLVILQLEFFDGLSFCPFHGRTLE